MAAHAHTLGGQGGWITLDQEHKTSLADMVKPPTLPKIQNWLSVVVHACDPSYSGGWGRRIAWTPEARLRRAEIVPLHSSLGTKSETLSKKKKKSTVCLLRFLSKSRQPSVVCIPSSELREFHSLSPSWYQAHTSFWFFRYTVLCIYHAILFIQFTKNDQIWD